MARGYMAWDQAIQKAVLAEEAQSPALTGRFVVKGVACRPAFDLLKQMVAPYTPEYAAQKIGLSAEQIVALTEAYATTKPARIFTIYGIDRWHHGATFGRLIAALAALTGNLGVPGGGAGVDGFCEGAIFNGDFTAPEGRAFLGINPATLPNQIVIGQPYPIKGVFVAFNNWLSQWPNQNYLRESVLPQLDLLVVADQSMTETARWADYILPAAHLFEREDMVKGPGPYVQYQPQIVPPPGECRSDFAIAAGLADRLGMGRFFSCAPADYLKDILASLPDDQPALSFDELRAKGVLRRNLPTEPPVAFRDRIFQTPTGRVEFYVERLLPFGRALPDYEPPAEAQLDGAQAQRYPLVLITEHSRYRVHSTFVNAPWLREIDVEPRATIHPAVAAARRIADGDWVRVFNDRGFVVLRAQISQSVSPEMIVMSQGWRSSDFVKGHIQSLTHGIGNRLNAFGPNTSFFDVLVEVMREDGES